MGRSCPLKTDNDNVKDVKGWRGGTHYAGEVVVMQLRGWYVVRVW